LAFINRDLEIIGFKPLMVAIKVEFF